MPQLEIELRGHLLVAGARSGGVGIDQATACRFVDGRWVPYIPATALRGAVRIQLEALLRGAERGATAPYPFETPEDEPDSVPQDLVARLFGYSGAPTARHQGADGGSAEGCLRFSDALPLDPVAASRALSVRAGVEIDDRRATAAEQKLYFREVVEPSRTPLVFRAQLDTGDARPEELETLKVAVETTDALGAARSSGGGEIRLSWIEGNETIRARVTGDPTEATRARLSLTLLEPAHFGEGGPQGNHHATRRFIPGSTIRGAVAWALLRSKTVTPEDPSFQTLFVDPDTQASFGDGLAEGTPGQESEIRPLTRKRRRDADKTVVDLLADELARERVNRSLAEAGRSLHWVSAMAGGGLDSLSARPGEGLVRRIRTRVSLSRRRGTASDQKLFSIEQLEPWRPATESQGPESHRPVTFVAWVENLTPAGPDLLARLGGVSVLVGAGRNHGLGRVEVEVRFAGDRDFDQQIERARKLVSNVEDRAAELAGLAGLPKQKAPTGDDRVPLALVARSSFLPETEDGHPLAEPAPEVGEPVRRILDCELVGGYDQRPSEHQGSRPKPLKRLSSAVAAGSVYVYEVPREDLEAILRRVLPALDRGVGRRRESGCGRFEVFRDVRTREVRDDK